MLDNLFYFATLLLLLVRNLDVRNNWLKVSFVISITGILFYNKTTPVGASHHKYMTQHNKIRLLKTFAVIIAYSK